MAYKEVTMYDASRKWSDAQWARFLKCDKKEIPSIRSYMKGEQPGLIYSVDCSVFPSVYGGYDMYWQMEILYEKYNFKTYDEAVDFAKDFLMRRHLNHTQQKIFNLPANAVMMMNIRKRR